METTNEQIARIQQMEQHLDRASAAVMELSAALDKYQEARDLKRGVLSEDGIWNVLADSHELDVRLSEMVTEVLRRG